MTNYGKLFAGELTEWLLEANKLLELFIPYMEFYNMKDLPKYCAYAGK